MIKVIFTDIKDGEVFTVSYSREYLKNDAMKRMTFAQDVNHGICHIIGKLREEKKEEDKCQKQSKL